MKYHVTHDNQGKILALVPKNTRSDSFTAWPVALSNQVVSEIDIPEEVMNNKDELFEDFFVDARAPEPVLRKIK